MRRRAARDGEARTVFKLCSLLLGYPDAELRALRPEVEAAVASLASSGSRAALERFCSWWSATDPLAAEQHYVEAIDLHKRSGLYLTFYAEGEKRQRGAALLRLKQLYRSAGLPLEGTELPDYLPVMLEFAADAPEGRGRIVLEEHRAALELIRLGLREAESPYAELLEAVCLAVGDLSAAEGKKLRRLIAEGPPSETVGLEPFAPPDVMPAAEARR